MELTKLWRNILTAGHHSKYDMDIDKLRDHMSEDWIAALKPFLGSREMDAIISSVKRRAKREKVIPSSDKVFNTFKNCPYNDLKIVILGQDPYPNENDACGSAFSAGDPIHTPRSLENILKEVERDTGKVGEEDNDLSRWEEQGVLLLNTSLTVAEGQPGSHRGIWKPFIKEVFRILNSYHSGLIFMLWGNHARNYKKWIGKHHYILEATHPSPLSAYKGKDPFMGCSHFTKANEIIEKLNGPEYKINW